MPSVWTEQEVEERVVQILEAVPTRAPVSALGRPFVTGYQIAIALDDVYDGIREALLVEHQLGGRGIGEHHSFAQYIARELSRRFREGTLDDRIEGAFLSNQNVVQLSYTHGITSSATESGNDLSLFRLRQ